MADQIADMLTIIRNAQAVGHETVKVTYSNFKYNLAQLLAKEGLIKEVEKKGSRKKPVIIITLKYNKYGKPTITGLNRISKPGQRIYVKSSDIKKVRGGYGIGVVSTSQGLFTDKEAREKHMGGEYLAEVW